MRKLLALVVLSASMSAAAVAQQPPADPHGHDAKPAAPIPGTSSPGTSSMSSQPAASDAMGAVDEHMKRMRALHERMMQASTPDERRELMAEARREMQAGMVMMGSMMHPSASSKMSPGSGTPDDAARLENLERRMDMMQMMMQMMMDERRMGAGSMRGGGRPK